MVPRKKSNFVRIKTEETVTKDTAKREVKRILTNYLTLNNFRKTPERYAILDAVYSIQGHFTLEELGNKLEKENFRVSRATLYNTMRLFIELRLVVRHRFIGQTKYEACYFNESPVHQVCTVCAKVIETDSEPIRKTIQELKLPRFHKDGFTLYIYGVCSKCQMRLTRLRNKQKKQIKDKS